MSDRRATRLAALACGLLMSTAVSAATVVDVIKGASCGCCVAWIETLEEAGFSVTSEDVAQGALVQAKMDAGIPADLASCHTAKVDGYVIEGHVPAREIERLLDERPDAIGLAVPGMPLGSPGMEYGDEADAYDVLLVKADGTTEVYASYPAR
ncbi:DUF411 domain-containing protein [Lutibaculum baratangense]|uniref:CopG protein n=1 Tax=Lutibaculum baratangense AMV1 TaxID=631454 RepID=V4RVA1_9HYPH|nr:DUF411 domain-containing protein [Lutibaculum baratangense]ESR26965.1 CopG protein [Lutibaculum baratangense AMV1]